MLCYEKLNKIIWMVGCWLYWYFLNWVWYSCVMPWGSCQGRYTVNYLQYLWSRQSKMLDRTPKNNQLAIRRQSKNMIKFPIEENLDQGCNIGEQQIINEKVHWKCILWCRKETKHILKCQFGVFYFWFPCNVYIEYHTVHPNQTWSLRETLGLYENI